MLPAEMTPGCCADPLEDGRVLDGDGRPGATRRIRPTAARPRGPRSSAPRPSGTRVIAPTVRTSSAELTSSAHASATSATTRTGCSARRVPRAAALAGLQVGGRVPAHQHQRRHQPEGHRHADDEREGQPEHAQAHRRFVEAGIVDRRDARRSGAARPARRAARRRRRPPTGPGSRPAAASTSCRGAAPSAMRTAISRSRDSARVSSSEATFRQPITSSSADGAEQHHQRRPVVAELFVEQRHHRERPALVAARELLAEPGRQRVDRGSRLLDRRRRPSSRATASMKCAPRLCCVRSHCSRCQTSTSSGKWKPAA